MPPPDFSRYDRKTQIAARKVDTDASEAQRDALRSRVGKLFVHGLELSIEYPKGSVRWGTSEEGKKWSKVMHAHYGRINRTTGKDGMHVDFFLGEHPSSQLVFVISQLDAEGNLDEHKCVLGTRNVDEAKKLYLSHYPEGWRDLRMGEVRGMFMPNFRKWLQSNQPVKNTNKKAAGSGYFCHRCNEFIRHRSVEDGCPVCDERDRMKKAAAWGGLSSRLRVLRGG
jgi:hypothetical protein